MVFARNSRNIISLHALVENGGSVKLVLHGHGHCPNISSYQKN